MAAAEASLLSSQVRGGDLLIFVSLGTHEQPFERALDLVLPLADEEPLVIQCGHTAPRDGLDHVEWRRFMSYDEVARTAESASSLICHAGVGTIITALRHGKTPVVVPRLHDRGEHVDDHQLQIARQLHESGKVVACMPGDSLPARVREARARTNGGLQGSGRLRTAVATAAGVPS